MDKFNIFGGASALLFAAVWPALPAMADNPLDLKLSGRVLYDYTQADADTAGFEVDETELRSARLAVSGKSGIVALKVELETDEAGETAEWRKAALGSFLGFHDDHGCGTVGKL